MLLSVLRSAAEKSRREVAEALGMTVHGVRRIEIGGDTSVSTLEAYARAIGVDFIVAYNSHRYTRESVARGEKVS
jgi:transcriptional regulator with XRE-family HTH domain